MLSQLALSITDAETKSDFILVLFSQTTFPAIENILSDDAEVEGTDKVLLATLVNIGSEGDCNFHHIKGLLNVPFFTFTSISSRLLYIFNSVSMSSSLQILLL